jgi:hypothetical protein
MYIAPQHIASQGAQCPFESPTTGVYTQNHDDGNKTEPPQKVFRNKNKTTVRSDTLSVYLIYLFANGLFHQPFGNVNNFHQRQASEIDVKIAKRVKLE